MFKITNRKTIYSNPKNKIMQIANLSPAQYVAIDILSYLRENAIGAVNRKSQNQIRTALIENLGIKPELERKYSEKDISKAAAFREKIQSLRALAGSSFCGFDIAPLEIVCADNSGYYLPNSEKELRLFRDKLQKIANCIQSTVYHINTNL